MSSKKPSFFSVISTAKEAACYARLGKLYLGRNLEIEIPTPAFMPVGTQASVKGMWTRDISDLGYRLILGNTYHLSLRPGSELIAKMGGLKKFMDWPHAILTDSGGYQVFSLSQNVRFYSEGVEFRSHIDGSSHLFTPSRVVDLQMHFGSDIFMVLDDCPPAYAQPKRIDESLVRTHRWAKEAIDHYRYMQGQSQTMISKTQRVFGIVQGGLDQIRRKESLAYIQSLAFDGIALGGLSVGEERHELYQTLELLAPLMDTIRPHYLMGVGSIADILEAVKNGVDMFDCVLPTRNGRNGQAFSSQGLLKIRNQIHRYSQEPLDSNCSCRVCTSVNRAYLRHLFVAGEMLGPMMLSYHNLYFYANFMDKLRQAIKEGQFMDFYHSWKKIC